MRYPTTGNGRPKGTIFRERVRRALAAALAVALIAAGSTTGRAQYTAPPGKPGGGYYDYYLKTYRTPTVSPARYTYDKYFYHNDTISPYINLTRPTGPYVNNAFTFVAPEIRRRTAETLSQISPQKQRQFATQIQGVKATELGVAPKRTFQPTANGAFQSHYYSGRAQLGLK